MSFDEIIQRRGTHSVKWDMMEPIYGVPADKGISMWVADMDFRAPDCVQNAVARMHEHGIYGYYGDDKAYRAAICWWMEHRHGWAVDPAAIFTTHGLVNGTAMCVETFTNPGDGVVLMTPVYHAFAKVIKANNRKVIECPLVLEDGRYQMDFATWDAQMDGSAKMLVLCSPHNPGGRVWTVDELQQVADANAGISIVMPTAAVGFEKYEYPFAHYSSTGDLPAKVLLISQKGDRTALFGLYDIMQTLAIVPPEGPRRRDSDGFFLIGQGTDFISHTEVTLQNGEIKGFTLLWPAGDEERRTRLLGEMQKSLQRQPGTLTPDMIGDQQRVDLVAGLKIRTPRLTRSGFFVDPQGHVVTALEAVQNCSSVTLETGIETNVTAVDAKLGIAILGPRSPIAPPAYAAFQADTPVLNSDIAVSGYSYGGLLGAPTLTFGSLADLQGLAGEDMLNRLQLASLPGDVGGPVVDVSGAVLGMLLPGAEANSGRTLPEDVQFSLAGPVLRDTLAQLGLSPRTTGTAPGLPAEQLTDKAEQMTVLVNCWE